jgi:hypothetical protein
MIFSISSDRYRNGEGSQDSSDCRLQRLIRRASANGNRAIRERQPQGLKDCGVDPLLARWWAELADALDSKFSNRQFYPITCG